jgi:hypothetical protein
MILAPVEFAMQLWHTTTGRVRACSRWAILACCLTATSSPELLAQPADGETIPVKTIGLDEEQTIDCRVRSLAAPAFDFAFNPHTGELAAIETEFARLRVYPPGYLAGSNPARPRSATVGTRPVSVVCKQWGDRSYYLVACETGSELVVVDAATLEEVHRTNLPARDLTQLWTSRNADDPNVYYSFQLQGTAGARVINAETWEDAGTVVEPGTLFGVSADGRYLAASGQDGAKGRSLTIHGGRVVATRPSYCTLQSHANICATDPLGLYLLVGERFPFTRVEVWRGDLSRQVNTLDFAVLTFSEREPWMVGYRPKDTKSLLVFASYPALGPLFQLEYPGTPLERQFQDAAVQLANYRAPRRFRVFCDDERDQLLVAFNEHVISIPLTDLPLPDGAIPHALLPLNAAASIDQELQIPVAQQPPEADVRVRTAPDGVVLEDGDLRWTPTAEHIGRHAVELDFSLGDRSHRQWIEVSVDRPALTLDALSKGDSPASVLHFDSAGDRLLVASHPSTGESLLQLIDLKSGETTATAPLPPSSNVHRVIVPSGDGEDLLVFYDQKVSVISWPRLELVMTCDIGGNSPLQDIVLVGNQWLVGTTQNRLGIERRRLPGGEPVPFPALIGGIHEHTGNGLIGGIGQELIGSRFADGWISEGVYYSQDLQTPQLLFRPWGFIRSERLDVGPLLRLYGTPAAPPVTSGNSPDRIWFDGGKMQLLAGTASRPFVPPEGQPGTEDQLVTLSTWSLAAGQQVDSHPLCLTDGYLNHWEVRVFPGQDEALIMVTDKLYRWPLPPSTADVPSAEPALDDGPRFELKQSHLVADAAAPTEFVHSVTGGTAPYRFTVDGPRAVREMLPLAIGADTGTVTVDGPAASDWIIAHLSRPVEGANSGQLFDAYETVAQDEFQKIVGRPPQGVPVLLGLNVTVTDAANRTATLPYEFFIEIPRSDWQTRLQQAYDRLQQAAAEREQAQREAAERQRAEEARRQEQEKFGLAPPTEPVSMAEILGSLIFAAVISVLALPLHIPLSAVFLRAAFALEFRFATRAYEELEFNANWGPALLTASATQGGMILVGFVVALLARTYANMAALAPLYTAILIGALILIAQWAFQALMVKLILKLSRARALRVSLYQSLISVCVALICVGFFMGGMALLD